MEMAVATDAASATASVNAADASAAVAAVAADAVTATATDGAAATRNIIEIIKAPALLCLTKSHADQLSFQW